MIFVTCNGEFIEMNKYDYVNDKLFYEKMMELRKSNLVRSMKKNKDK
jgi:hypothetical protein